MSAFDRRRVGDAPRLPPMVLLARAAVLCLLVAGTGACTPAEDRRRAAGPGSPTTSDGAPDVALREAALAVVEQRDIALRTGDREAFLATVDPAATDFLRAQERWFDNLSRLPLADVSLTLGDEDVMTSVAAEGAVQLPVELTTRLRGFDRRPSTQPAIYTFSRDGQDVLVTDDRNLQSDALTGWVPAPWDVAEIDVRRAGPVLGVFDEATAPGAAYTMTDLAAAGDAVRAELPGWDGRVVVYAISDVEAIDRMSLMPVRRTAGVAFGVPVRPGSLRVAGMRLALNPRSTQAPDERALVITHEVVHVALGERDDLSPTWLVEGSAEHVARLQVPADVLAGHQRSLAERHAQLPLVGGADFYQRRPSLNYESAALVCDYLATTRGGTVLWRLMDAFARAEVVSYADIDEVLSTELGVTARQLAAAARAWALAG
jgi:hypothetical protein